MIPPRAGYTIYHAKLSQGSRTGRDILLHPRNLQSTPFVFQPTVRKILHNAWVDVHSRHRFETIAVCLLSDHIHAIWKMPEDDADYPMRWKEIKRIFTRNYISKVGPGGVRNESRQIQGEAAIFQQRYWEHTFYGEDDLNTHIDYIHINPLKHGLVKQASDWPWSTFHHFVRKGVYPADWGGKVEMTLMDKDRGE